VTPEPLYKPPPHLSGVISWCHSIRGEPLTKGNVVLIGGAHRAGWLLIYVNARVCDETCRENCPRVVQQIPDGRVADELLDSYCTCDILLRTPSISKCHGGWLCLGRVDKAQRQRFGTTSGRSTPAGMCHVSRAAGWGQRECRWTMECVTSQICAAS
jgi:hypothetical protein